MRILFQNPTDQSRVGRTVFGQQNGRHRVEPGIAPSRVAACMIDKFRFNPSHRFGGSEGKFFRPRGIAVSHIPTRS